MRHPNRSGQALMIGVLLLAVLLVAVPSIILFNRLSTESSARSQRRLNARAIAEEGIASAKTRIMAAAAPNLACTNPAYDPYFNGSFVFSSAAGKYTVSCFAGPEAYE